jgi:ring-1,2-phenylacetyl-CoA epoxidase subunit PaaC
MTRELPDSHLCQLCSYLLHLADNNLVLSQRNAEWCGHGPVLEQDIAITNISLDLLGQARNFYQYAARLLNGLPGDLLPGIVLFEVDKHGILTEDSIAYLRPERAFKNCQLVELPRQDWAATVCRQFFYSVFQRLLYSELLKNNDGQLAAIAEKSLKEVNYHVKWSSEWVIRLGDGTMESQERTIKAARFLWPYVGEFFSPAPYESPDITGFDLPALRHAWQSAVKAVLVEATIWPQLSGETGRSEHFCHTGGKTGVHTEYLGYILAEMQYLQRAHPGANW